VWRLVRSLSPEEAELWSKVVTTIQPLSRDKKQSQSIKNDLKSLSRAPAKPAAEHQPSTRRNGRPRLGSTLDGSWDRRLRKGDLEPDRVLDLHGMYLDTAWRAIDHALEQAIIGGERVVLLIAGHHRPGDVPVKRGRIRASVHDWLSASRHAPQIAAVRAAHRRHGGGGSLYLILRRR
jgi:DNA-nicking Smr family endonuclease